MSEYDPAKDSHDSYYAAIEAKRLRGDANPIKREAYAQPDMFLPRAPEPKQEALGI